MLEITEKLRKIGGELLSNDLVINYIQNRLWDTKDYFNPEKLDIEIVGEIGIWWKVESMTSSVCLEYFDEEKDVLLGFINKNNEESYIKFLKTEFCKKYLS